MKQTSQLSRDLDGLPAFLLVAEHRSFRAAAAELGVSPSALSQTIKALEARLGIALFQRTTRSVGLTEAGERFLERARPAMAGFREAIEAARSLSERPSGLLRINASRGVIASLIGPVLPSFIAAYPEVEVEIYADDGFVDIVREWLRRRLPAGGIAAGRYGGGARQPTLPFRDRRFACLFRTPRAARDSRRISGITPASDSVR